MSITFSKKLAIVAATGLVLAACGGEQKGAESPDDADMAAEDEEMGLDDDMGDEGLGDDEFDDDMGDEGLDDEGMGDEGMGDEGMGDEGMGDEPAGGM